MINLIKSDLYRLFKSKAYKSCIIASIGVIIFILGLTIFTDVELWLMLSTGKEGIKRGFLIGLENNVGFKELIINALGSGMGIYVIGITLTSSIVMSRNRSGMMKNTVSYGYDRWKIYLSQVISLILGVTILITGIFFSVLFITTLIYRPSDISLEVILMIMKSWILYIMIVASTISIYTLLLTVIQSSEVMFIIAIIEIIGMTMIESSLPVIVTNWIPYSMIRAIAQISDAAKFIQYLITSLVIIGISSYLGILVFNKKDTR